MRYRLLGLVLMTIFAAGLALPGWSAPLDPALQQQLLDIYNRYNRALAAGKLDEAMQLRTAAVRQEMQKDLKDKKQREAFLAFAKDVIPDSLEVRKGTLATDGNRASIATIASKTVPAGAKTAGGPPPGTTFRNQIQLDFVKEGGNWKFATQTFGMDPDKIKPCASEAFDAIEAFDPDRSVSMGGPIRRVAFKADHTLVVVLVVDEENCAFLPDRENLKKAGLNTDLLVADAIVEIEGFPHRTDTQKLCIDQLTVRGEE